MFELNPDTAEILGRPNFTCGPIARLLRTAGKEIEEKAESEQAAVIHWLLTIYDEHGSDWRKHAAVALKEMSPNIAGPAEPGNAKE